MQDQVYDAAGKAKEKATIQLFNTNLKSRINAFKTQKGDVRETVLCYLDLLIFF